MRLNVKPFADEKFPANRNSRRNANINQFARAIGLTVTATEKIYDGDTTRIDFDTLEAICKVLECTPNDIIASDDPDVNRLLLYADKIQRNESKEKGDSE